MIKKILSVAVLSFVTLSSISASAMANPLVKSNLNLVNSKSGLVIRNRDCKKIDSFANKAKVYTGDLVGGQDQFSTSPFTCRLNGKKVKMVLAASTSGDKLGYVSSNFLIPSYTTGAVYNDYRDVNSEKKYEVNKTSVNLRDENCKVVGTVYLGDILEKSDANSRTIICKIGARNFNMVPTSVGYISPATISLK